MLYCVSHTAVRSCTAMGGLFVFPQDSHVEALIPSVMVLELGAFERELGLD